MSEKTLEPDTVLAAFRRQIDDIDNKIIDLLLQRVKVVKKVGEHKGKTASPPCPIRSGREAEMLRSIVQRFSESEFPACAAASIWRIIIGASTGLEADMTLSVLNGVSSNNLYWLAREYFGQHSNIITHQQARRVVGDVVDGKAAVGIANFPSGAEENRWWLDLLQQENSPKIFAHIPFVCNNEKNKNQPTALAFARLRPEPSGDDKTIIAIMADANVSQSRLQTALKNAKLEAVWLDIAQVTPQDRYHLIEISGFLTPEEQSLANFSEQLNESAIRLHILGSYATPIKM